jgi:tetratricopeptide (TPR) repeat protein
MRRWAIAAGTGVLLLASAAVFFAVGRATWLTSADELDRLNLTVMELHITQKLDEAILPAERAVALAREKFGETSEPHARALSALGEIHRDGLRPAEAETLLRRALAVTETVHGPEHPETGKTLAKLGAVMLQQKRFDDAEPLLLHARAVLVRAEGPNSPSAAWAGTGLAEVLASRGRVDEAAALYRANVTAQQARWGADNPIVVHALQRLVDLYADHGRYAEAEAVARQRLSVSETVYAKTRDRLGVALSLVHLANLHMLQQRPADARRSRRGPWHWRKRTRCDLCATSCWPTRSIHSPASTMRREAAPIPPHSRRGRRDCRADRSR